MKVVIQRVKEAHVDVEGKCVGKVGIGVLVLIGITPGDTEKEVTWLAQKIAHLRIFEDSEGKLNRSLLDCQGSALIVSQFTLYGDCNEGRRPSFIKAAPPVIAEPLYEKFVQEMKKLGVPVETGVFGAMMQVSLINDGPITLILERNPNETSASHCSPGCS